MFWYTMDSNEDNNIYDKFLLTLSDHIVDFIYTVLYWNPLWVSRDLGIPFFYGQILSLNII